MLDNALLYLCATQVKGAQHQLYGVRVPQRPRLGNQGMIPSDCMGRLDLLRVHTTAKRQRQLSPQRLSSGLLRVSKTCQPGIVNMYKYGTHTADTKHYWINSAHLNAKKDAMHQ
jgi:hypothetical protein